MKYYCKENDNVLRLEEDELWVSDPLEKGWTIIGLPDLIHALVEFGVAINTKGSCDGGEKVKKQFVIDIEY